MPERVFCWRKARAPYHWLQALMGTPVGRYVHAVSARIFHVTSRPWPFFYFFLSTSVSCIESLSRTYETCLYTLALGDDVCAILTFLLAIAALSTSAASSLSSAASSFSRRRRPTSRCNCNNSFARSPCGRSPQLPSVILIFA